MRLFRFFDPCGGLLTLKNRKLRASHPGKFNDPFEMRPFLPLDSITEEGARKHFTSEAYLLKQFREVGLRQGLTREESDEKALAELEPNVATAVEKRDKGAAMGQQHFIDVTAKYFRFICASHSPSSILMWSHYAAKHEGIVLELEIDETLSATGDPPIFKEVIYRSELPQIVTHWPDDGWEEDHINVMRTKALSWAYEEEVRILCRIPKTLGDENLDLEFHPSVIKRVILGCKATASTKDQLKNIRAEPDYSSVIWQEARVRRDSYALDFVTLE